MATIYTLIDPRDQQVRYIGKTTYSNIVKRLRVHLTHARTGYGNTTVGIWIRELLEEGLTPYIKAVTTVENEEALEYEKAVIAAYEDLQHPILNTYGTSKTRKPFTNRSKRNRTYRGKVIH